MSNQVDQVDGAGIGTAVVRTMVPLLVSLVAAGLARAGLEIDDATRSTLVSAISLLVGTGYYVLVRELERRWPGAGWLLGSPHAPVYPSKVQPVAVDDTQVSLPFDESGE